MSHLGRRITNIFFAFVLAVMSVNLSGVLSVQSAFAATTVTPVDGKLTICHSHQPNPSNGQGQGPQGNPYNSETVAIDAVDGEGNNDHTSHTGVADGEQTHVFHPGDLSWGDIIPAYPAGTYKKGNQDIPYPAYEGLNWTTEGQAIYNNDCVVPQDATAGITVTPPTCNSPSIATITNLNNATLTSNAGTLNQTVGPQTAVFTATAGHYFSGYETTYSVTYTIAAKRPAEQCITKDAAAAVIVTPAQVCGTNGTATFTASHATLNAPLDQSIGKHTAVFTAEPGHAFSDGSLTKELKYEIKAGPKCPDTVIPTEPTTSDVCGVHADKYIIPSKNGVRYEVKVGQIGQNEIYAPIGDGTYPTLGAATVKIRAVAKNGYVLAGGTYSWVLNFDTAKCKVTAEVLSQDKCGTANDSYTVPQTAHVTYKIATTKWFYLFGFPIFQYTDYDVIPAETYPGSSEVTIKAFADLGYEIDGPDTWTLTFTDESCEPEPCTPSTVTLPQLRMLQASAVTANECTPGQGGAGGETPVEPQKPADQKYPAVVTELPQTGPEAGDAFAKVALIVAAGLTTYGAVFFAVNRRELLKK